MSTKESLRIDKNNEYSHLTKNDVIQLIQSCSLKSSTGIRNRALIAALGIIGLRTCETLNLLTMDIDFSTRTVNIRHIDSCKLRLIALDSYSFNLINDWNHKRIKIGIDAATHFFCTLNGKILNDSYIRHMLKRISVTSSINKRVHAEGLRQSCAIEMILEGNDIGSIKQKMGDLNNSTIIKSLLKHQQEI